MDKTKISYNNTIKFNKNKRRDKQLRHLDNRLALLNKKLHTLLKKRFMTTRNLTDLNSYSSASTKIYFLLLIHKIKLLLIKNKLKFYSQAKNNLSKKIFILIYSP